MTEFQATLPESLSLEVTSACNIHCLCCPVGNGIVKPHHMPLDDFKTIIDLLPRSIRQLDFSHRGDPLMNPEIISIIQYASKRGYLTDLYTNGMILDRYIQKLIRSGLTRIRIDLDGASQTSYGQYRIGGDFERVRSNVESLVQARRVSGSGMPETIMLICVVTSFNEKEISAIRKMAKNLGVDELRFKTAIINYGTKYYKDVEEQKKIAPKNLKYRRAARPEKFICPFLRRGAILYNGDLLVCTADFEGAYCMGNIIRKKSFEKVFFSDTAARIRKTIIDQTGTLCQTCAVIAENHYIPEISKKFTSIGKRFLRKITG